ncbi:17532_t:CDS:2 [Acaulospora colombiana]|uniref:17532_t:CDS:1 n=1 Tax=Acaulospora colombiana TaxID=27376 RepID=A0ACA9KHT0_9GLOM|nr:17532_t:CDS:2 [Acaulospora colombiana]
MAELVPYIVWEKQEGYLCAQHCINSLLQGEYFTAVDLGEIANNLDMAEQAALREGTVDLNENLHNEIPQKSQNMDDSGFFSLQVLSHALKVWNLGKYTFLIVAIMCITINVNYGNNHETELIPIGSEEGRNSRDLPENEIAYICNLAEHWFTLRRFGGNASRWYNLDSLLSGPKFISQTYLGMLLSQLENEGKMGGVKMYRAYQADEFAVILPDPSTQHSQSSHNIDFDADLEAAIAESLKFNEIGGSVTTENSKSTADADNDSAKTITENSTVKENSDPTLMGNSNSTVEEAINPVTKKEICDPVSTENSTVKEISDPVNAGNSTTKEKTAENELSLNDLRARRLAKFGG